MNIRKFAIFLIVVALFGLSGSGMYKASGEDDSSVGKTYFPSEYADRLAQAVKRADQGYADRESVLATEKIEDARSARRNAGQTGQIVFIGLGVLAIGLLLSAKPAA